MFREDKSKAYDLNFNFLELDLYL